MKNPNAFDDIYALVKLIPYGRVSSYGAIAAYLGMKGGARMVGWAMNASHTDPEIPAHRVVNRNGLLTGKMHFVTPTRMQELLESEGVQVEKDTIVGFHDLFWDPSVELAL
jgi:methylated-DNA-protein-cysteine methyltransferase-like protein